MKCEMAQEQIVMWTYGELDDELAVGLERHLAGCEGCQEEIAALRRDGGWAGDAAGG